MDAAGSTPQESLVQDPWCKIIWVMVVKQAAVAACCSDRTATPPAALLCTTGMEQHTRVLRILVLGSCTHRNVCDRVLQQQHHGTADSPTHTHTSQGVAFKGNITWLMLKRWLVMRAGVRSMGHTAWQVRSCCCNFSADTSTPPRLNHPGCKSVAQRVHGTAEDAV